MIKKVFKTLLSLSLLIGLVSCGPSEYDVSFYNEETLISTSKVAAGGYATYDGETPTKESDAEYTYSFSGWDKNLETTVINQNTSFYAEYDKTIRIYTVKFVNADANHTVLESVQVEYGHYASYTKETPTLDKTQQYTYTFEGWDNNPETTLITADTTFTAVYTSTLNEYTVRYYNYDNTLLHTKVVKYGHAAVYDGATPTKPSTNTRTYSFSGWDKADQLIYIRDDIDTFAEFKESIRYYSVRFNEYDGTEIYTTFVEYGSDVIFDTKNYSIPEKPDQGVSYAYEFRAWDKSLLDVKENLVVNPIFYEIELKTGTDGLEYGYYAGYYAVTGYEGAATDVVIPYRNGNKVVKAIGAEAFKSINDQSKITSVYISEGVKTIYSEAFAWNSYLTTVRTSWSITKIESLAFQYCRALKEFKGENVTSIAEGAFRDCNDLEKIEFGSSLSSIGMIAFAGCSSLTTIDLSSVSTIDTRAFAWCGGLVSVTIPANCLALYDGAFSLCDKLEKVEFLGDKLVTLDVKSFYQCPSLNDIILPSSLKNIGEQSFYDCYDLATLIIPDKVTTLEEEVLYSCSSLTSLSLPAGIISFGIRAIANCTSLQEITFRGTKFQWSEISKGGGWRDGSPITKIICTDGEVILSAS